MDLDEMRDKKDFIKKDMAQEIINMKWPEIAKAVSLSEMLAAHTCKEDIEQSVLNMRDKANRELARYKSLEIEPGSYQSEIDALTQNAKESAAYLQSAKPKLMALCVWINFYQ